jgi:zinc D-Ala-D-Ala carboxypeptidase
MIGNGNLFTSATDFLTLRIPWRWKNFTPLELSSPNSGEYYHHIATLDAIQSARDILGRPLVINSGHRDWLHNIAVRGAPRSAHLWIAVDISLIGQSPWELYRVLKAVGFSSFGLYKNFIHADLRPGRLWYGSEEAREKWTVLIEEEVG